MLIKRVKNLREGKGGGGRASKNTSKSRSLIIYTLVTSVPFILHIINASFVLQNPKALRLRFMYYKIRRGSRKVQFNFF